MKVGIIVQTRMGSTRLPGKVMKDILGMSMLEHMINRLKRSQRADAIIIATTTKDADNVIADFAADRGVDCFRGDEEDVLSRYYLAAKEFDVDLIVRITSDCPLIDPEIIDKMIDFYLDNKEDLDYLSNTIERTYPRGLDTEIFSFKVLEQCAKDAKDPYYREHVTTYVADHPDKFRIKQIKNDIDYSDYRWTVDTNEDFELINKIYRSLYKEGGIFLFGDIIRLFEKEPELKNINMHVRQKTRYSR